jgi:hypothetical protein
MGNTYIWDITGIQAYPFYEGKSDVVVAIHWILTGTDGIFKVERRGAVGIEYVPTSEFKPYESLTKDEIIAWVQASLGEEGVQEALDGVDNDLKQLASQPVFTNVPWSTSN